MSEYKVIQINPDDIKQYDHETYKFYAVDKASADPEPEPDPGSTPSGNDTPIPESGKIYVEDYPSIQAAFDAAEDRSLVVFPLGLMIVNEPIKTIKNLSVTGCGSGTMIYQQANLPLFDVHTQGKIEFSNMWLGSAATDKDAALIRLRNKVVHASIWDLALSGGGTGILLEGVLESLIDNVNAGQGFPKKCSRAKYWIRGYRSGSRSINAVTIRDCQLGAGADYGIHITDRHAEGSINIRGGSIQVCSQKGIYLSRINQIGSISDVHIEYNPGGGIQVDRCNNISVKDCFVTDRLEITNCRGVDVSGGEYPNGIEIDLLAEDVEIDNITLGSKGIITRNPGVKVGSRINIPGKGWNCASGMYSPGTPIDLLTDSKAEVRRWMGSEEFDYFPFNGSSIKGVNLKSSGNCAALTYPIPVGRYIRRYGINLIDPAKYIWVETKQPGVYELMGVEVDEQPLPACPVGVWTDTGNLVYKSYSGDLSKLAPGQWDYGFSEQYSDRAGADGTWPTVYVCLPDGVDPDTLPVGSLKCQHHQPKLTVSCMAYKPVGGYDPRISVVYDYSGSAATHSNIFALNDCQWTPITATFRISPRWPRCYAHIGSWYHAKAGQECIIADWKYILD